MEEQRDVCFLMGSTHHTTGHNVLELLYRPRPPPATPPPLWAKQPEDGATGTTLSRVPSSP